MSHPVENDRANAGALSEDRRSADWDVAAAPRNYASLAGAQVVSAALALVAIWIVTRLVGRDGYGRLVAMLAAGQCIGQIAIQWSAPSLIRFGCQEFVETGRVAAAFRIRLKVLVAAFLVVGVTMPLWFPVLARVLHLSAEARWPVLAFVITTGFWVHVQYALQSAKLLQLQARILAGERVTVIAGLALLAAVGQARPATLVFVYVVTPLLASLVGVWGLRGLLAHPDEMPPSRWKEMLSFSLPFVPATIVGYLSSNYFDAFFITYYRSTADLGHYNLVFQIAGMAMQLPLLAGSVALPLFITLKVNGEDERLRRYFGTVVPVATLAWSIACALGAAVAELLIPVVFGEAFGGSGRLIWPLMAASAFSAPVLMGYNPLASARARTDVNLVSSAVIGGLNALLNVLWIPRWGLAGCAWATAVSYAASLVVWMWLVDDRPALDRWRVAEATLPATCGALAGAVTASLPVALATALAAGAIVLVLHRSQVTAGLAALRSHA